MASSFHKTPIHGALLLPLLFACGATCTAGGRGGAAGREKLPALVAATLPAVVKVRPAGRMAQDGGSGFFVAGRDGRPVVVTNHHVIWGASELAIETNDGTVEAAEVAGVDPETDLAILRLTSNASTPKVLAFGGDEALSLGDSVVAVGSPGGVSNAVSLGIVSARGLVPRGTVAAQRFIEHLFIDAAVAAGSSGGPVLGMDGRVVGVTTGVVGGISLGIVAPDRLVANVVDRLQRDGAIRHSWSGLRVTEDPGSGHDGAVKITAVASVQAEPPLRVGDVIVRLDGSRLRGSRDFQWREFSDEPGRTWRLNVVRGSEQIVVSLTLQPLTQAVFARQASGPPSL